MTRLNDCGHEPYSWCDSCVNNLYNQLDELKEQKEKWKQRALESCIQPYSYAPHSSGYKCKYCNQFSLFRGSVEHSHDCPTNEE